MIHELIDPKKKTNKASVSKNTKTIQNNKNVFEYCNFENSDCDNKKTDSSSAFIPPWLRHSLGLNQRNILSHATTGSDPKSSKIIQRDKEPSQNEFDSLKRNNEQDCCKEWKDNNDTVTKECPQDTAIAKIADNAESPVVNSERITTYHSVKSKASESESSSTNAETKFSEKGDTTKIDIDVLISPDTEKLKDGDLKRIKLIKQKPKLKKRMSADQKLSDLDKNEIDFLLEMKAREVVENIKKKDVHSISSEIRNLETKLMLLGAKPHDLNSYKLKQQDIRSLQEVKSRMVSVEEFKRLFEHLKEMNLRDFVKSSEFLAESATEKKRDEKEDKKEKKSVREIVQKCENERKFSEDQDFLLSTDDEENIKRFSQFLSKNENLEEKRKCLEEVRNYFEKKRKLRMAKRRCLEEEKKKTNPKSETQEEILKEKAKVKDGSKGKKSKFGLCDEDVVEKAVEETLQKFIDLYHIHLTPAAVEAMKRNIFQCMSSNFPNSRRSSPAAKKHLEQPNSGGKELENAESPSFAEELEIPSKEPIPCKEIKKKNLKNLIESTGEHNSSLLKETETIENEKLNRLRKEFDNFLHSVKFHIDFTNLKLQSIILEKEEQAASSKNVQFVYNFTKKSLEPEKLEFPQPAKEASEMKNSKDDGTQTSIEAEISRRNVKVQAFEHKCTLEQSLQTEDKSSVAESTQTNDERVAFREWKDLNTYDVSPGLYRMVKSREAGKFYLYPEQLDDMKQAVCQSSSFSFVADKKVYRKRDLLNMLSKGSVKDRRVFFKERDKTKLKKSKKTSKAAVHFEGASKKKNQTGVSNKNSVNCLYFRNIDKSNSDLFSPKKVTNLTEENTTERTDDSDEQGLGDADQMSNKDHLGCFWFWNGEKISPGCDLKTHVEKLLKEKLREMITFDGHNNGLVSNSAGISKNSSGSTKVVRKSAGQRISNAHHATNENLMLAEEERADERNKTEEKKTESEETEATVPLSEEKGVRTVATQNSQQICTSINLSKLKIQSSKIGFPVRKRSNKRNVIIKPGRGKPANMKKAEHIVKAIEELKRLKLEAGSSKKENPRDSESLLNFSLSTKESKTDVGTPLPGLFGRADGHEVEDLHFKNKLKKLISLVNCEMQRNDVYEMEDGNPTQSQSPENHKHFELIETVLNRITHKERETLWNDVRDFIKTRISRGMNDDDDREVCIEIEQDLPKNDQGKLRDILAKGHYRRNEGDIEVEIDLTLDDLERILRQRQKKIRRRNLYHSSTSNKYLSTSTIQSEFIRDDLRRYQKYLQNFSASGGGRVQEKEMKAFL